MKSVHSSSRKLNNAAFVGCVFVAVSIVGCSGSETLPKTDASGDVSAGDSAEFNPPVSEQPPVQMPPAAALPSIEHVANLFVAEEQTATGTEVFASAAFYRLTTPLDTPPSLRPAVGLDVCEIGSEASQINTAALNFPIDHMLDSPSADPLQVSSISAGQSVELSSTAGSYLSLGFDAEFTDGVGYVTQDGADTNMTVPDALNGSVSGDAFPVLEWQWSKSALLASSLRADIRAIGSNPTLNWNSAEQSELVQSQVFLYAASINELSGAYQSFNCKLQDDGEFTMPENIQALYAKGFSAQFVELARYTRSVQLVENISVVNVFMQKF